MQRISKREAVKRFADDQPIYLCPCKMRPEGPLSSACLILGKEYTERAEWYRDDPKLWEGDIVRTAWALMYNNWRFYNASHETGYYAHYYIA